MSGGAHVGSIDAVRDFRAALITFLHEARESLNSFDMESRRTLEWLQETQPQYWHHEARRSDELLTQAKIELERCRNSRLPGGEAPSCMEERKAVERARHRKQYAEDKLETTRKWGYIANREAIEYAGRANQLASLFDAQGPAAIALFDRVLHALEAYLAVSQGSGSPGTASGSGGATAVSRPLDQLPANGKQGENNDAPAIAKTGDATGEPGEEPR